MNDFNWDFADDASSGFTYRVLTKGAPAPPLGDCHRWRRKTDTTLCGIPTKAGVWTAQQGGCPACVAIAVLETQMATLLPRHPIAWLQARQRILSIRRATRSK